MLSCNYSSSSKSCIILESSLSSKLLFYIFKKKLYTECQIWKSMGQSWYEWYKRYCFLNPQNTMITNSRYLCEFQHTSFQHLLIILLDVLEPPLLIVTRLRPLFWSEVDLDLRVVITCWDSNICGGIKYHWRFWLDCERPSMNVDEENSVQILLDTNPQGCHRHICFRVVHLAIQESHYCDIWRTPTWIFIIPGPRVPHDKWMNE